MCSAYWNLKTKLKCPKCSNETVWDLQTHFMGEPGSCINEYELGQKVNELKKVTVSLNGNDEGFCGSCPDCKKFFDLGAEINKGIVKKVFFV